MATEEGRREKKSGVAGWLAWALAARSVWELDQKCPQSLCVSNRKKWATLTLSNAIINLQPKIFKAKLVS